MPRPKKIMWKRVRWIKQGVLIMISLSISFVVLEVGAHYIIKTKDASPEHIDENILNIYQTIDPQDRTMWLLKPNTSFTMKELIDDKVASNKSLAVNVYKERDSLDEIVLTINSDGFRGPKIRPFKGQKRIVIIGDSCSFGLLDYSYPRAIEQNLLQKGFDVEVINTAVEGYKVDNYLKNKKLMAKIDSLKPDLILVYLGWNDLYSNSRSLVYKAKLASIELFERTTNIMFKPEVVGNSPVSRFLLPDYLFTDQLKYENDYRSLLLRLRSQNSQILILSLPHIINNNSLTSDKAKKVSHYPGYVQLNAKRLLAAKNDHNFMLQKLAAEQEVLFFDLSFWANNSLTPSHEFFVDGVHLNKRGLKEIGKKLSEHIAAYW